jgi:hypothetical protein
LLEEQFAIQEPLKLGPNLATAGNSDTPAKKTQRKIPLDTPSARLIATTHGDSKFQTTFTIMCSCFHLPHIHHHHTNSPFPFANAKTPVDPELHGYVLEKQEWLEADTWHVWRVKNSSNDAGHLSKIGVDPSANRLCVFDANNKYDQFPANSKLSLRDLMMGIWSKKHSKQPLELRSVLIQSIVGADVQALRDDVYSLMKKGSTTDTLVVSCDGHTNEERKAFKMLEEKNPHGNGVKKMVNEYEGLNGKKIKQFVLEQPPYQSLQMNIVIG